MSALLIAAPVVPLLAATLIVAVGERFPRAAGWINAGGSAVSLGVLLALLGQRFAVGGVWTESGTFKLTVGLQLDDLSHFTALLVAGIALFVNLYAISYMAEEEGQPRFFAEMSFFVGSMLALVLASSLLLLFAAWEAVGVASFLLIGFWYHKEEARSAARKAFLITRLGDVGMLLGWLGAMLLVGTTDIGTFLSAVAGGAILPETLTVLALLFLCGAVGKSAQLPFTAWLPPAMVGPTPVSALIHSATMVAAGVYLLLRLFPLFDAAPGVLTVVSWI